MNACDRWWPDKASSKVLGTKSGICRLAWWSRHSFDGAPARPRFLFYRERTMYVRYGHGERTARRDVVGWVGGWPLHGPRTDGRRAVADFFFLRRWDYLCGSVFWFPPFAGLECFHWLFFSASMGFGEMILLFCLGRYTDSLLLFNQLPT